MGRAITLGGYRLSVDEWSALDDDARDQLLRTFIETSPLRADEHAYESYELRFDTKLAA